MARVALAAAGWARGTLISMTFAGCAGLDENAFALGADADQLDRDAELS